MNAKFWLGPTAVGLVAMFLMTGCSEETPPGGPGAATVTEDGDPAQPDQTFTLTMPTGATNIEQGSSQTVSIGVDRGEQFQEEVTVTFQPPQGVTIEPEQLTLAAGQDEGEVTVKVDPTVQPGEMLIQVTGEGGSGPPSPGQLTIEVTERDQAGAGGDDTPAAGDNPPAAAPATPEATDPAPTQPNPEGGAPAAQDPNAAPANPANPEGGAPAVREENVENAETSNPQ